MCCIIQIINIHCRFNSVWVYCKGGIDVGDLDSGTFVHRLGALEKQVDKLSNTSNNSCDRILILEKNQETVDEKLEGLSKHTEAIVNMSYEVKNLATKVEDVVGIISKQEIKIDKQVSRINNIESKPGTLAVKAWAMVAATIATTVLGTIVGYFIK